MNITLTEDGERAWRQVDPIPRVASLSMAVTLIPPRRPTGRHPSRWLQLCSDTWQCLDQNPRCNGSTRRMHY